MTPSSAEFRTVINELTRERLADGIVCAIENCFGPDALAEDNDSVPPTLSPGTRRLSDYGIFGRRRVGRAT